MQKILEKCNRCESGSCCEEGVELSKDEVRRIIAWAPQVKKPWFRLVDPENDPAPGYNYETLVRDGRCVFQREDKKCRIYSVRPKHCNEFPLEGGKLAQYYHRLCGNQRDILT